MLEHEDGAGTTGVVINMPTPLLISHLGMEEEITGAGSGQQGGRLRWRVAALQPNLRWAQRALYHPPAAAFGRCPLFIGGPLGKERLHILHGRRDVEGSMEVVDGVYIGGLEHATEQARAFCPGAVSWGPQKRQCLWRVAAAAPAGVPGQVAGAGAGQQGGRVHAHAGAPTRVRAPPPPQVLRAEAAPGDFVMLCGYAQWGPWQLAQVIASLV